MLSYKTHISQNNRVFQLLVLLSLIAIIPAFQEVLSFRFTNLILAVVSISTFVLILFKYSYVVDTAGWIYCFVLLISIIFHYGISIDNPFKASAIWINVILLIYWYKNKNYHTPILLKFAFLFYIFECGLCIIEKIGHFYLIDYSEAENMLATNLEASQYDSLNFRAHGLLLHPLYNANVISLFMGYIIVSKQLNKIFRYVLIALGLLGIWACNSRACLAIWIIILMYKMFFYNKKIILICISALLLYITIPFVIEFLNQTHLLGRLDFDFSDSSSETRFIAFSLFASYPWTIENILLGIGDWIYYPLSTTTLENGFLLNMAYWGWLIGGFKSFIEIFLTYKCISQYRFRDKIIIMLAIWGVASANNNMTSPLLLTFFILVNATLSIKQLQKTIDYEYN